MRLALGAFLLLHSTAGAQDRLQHAQGDSSVVRARPAWFSRKDAAHVGGAAAALGVLSLLDGPVARVMQRESLHRNNTLSHAVNGIQIVGDPGALAISASLFVVGYAAHKPDLTDASRHSLEAIVASGAVTQLLKLSVGRARPNLSRDTNAYMFHPFHGAQTDFNSFPSGHTSASFAAATVFSSEIRRLHPGAAKFTTPALYGIATLVGGARMYNNRHWLTDVAAGALIGHFVGKRISDHAHSTTRESR
ncbi:MAG: phosphatase PAP2 family protein [Gemmatimonadaceae bacterium]